MATNSESGKRLLSYIYSCHANFYSCSERYKESAVFASRALDVFPSAETPDQGCIMAGIISAAAAVYGSSRPHPEAGIEILNHWQDVVKWDDYNAWLLGDLATYMALTGNAEMSQNLAEQATTITMRNGRTYDIFLRQLDEAEVLVHIGKPAHALALLEQDTEGVEPGHVVRDHLLCAHAHIALQNTSRAQEYLQSALNLIQFWDLKHLRSQFDQLALMV